MDVRTPPNVPLSSTPRSLVLDSHAAAHVLLGAAQQAHQLAPPLHNASVEPLGATQQSPKLAPLLLTHFAPASLASSALPVLSLNPAVGSQPGLLLALLTIPFQPSPLTARQASPNSQTVRPSSPNSQITRLPSLNLQYAVQYSQSAPVRVSNTVLVPAVSHLGAPSAPHALASLAAAQSTALQPSAPFLFDAAAVQPVAQVGALDSTSAYRTRKVGAHLAVCAHSAIQVGALPAVGAQSYEQAGAQFASCAQPIVAAEEQFAVCAYTVSKAGASAAQGAHYTRVVGAHSPECAQPAIQVGAFPAVSAYSYEQAEAQLESCAQPVVAAKAQYASCA